MAEPIIAPSPNPDDIKKLFKCNPKVDPNTFEIALTLGGTVSAGAYTAGAVDFLIEALDCWTRARDDGDAAAPTHKAVIRVISGTSGGGVNAAIAARALAFNFPHIVRATRVPAEGTGNPFYDLWVSLLNLNGFLGTDDVREKNVTSLLCGKPIDDLADFITGFGGAQPTPPRSYIATPLRLILTFTNLRGVPYQTTFQSGLSETFVNHGDYLRTAVVYPDQKLPISFRPDEFVLGFGAPRLPGAIDWPGFATFAKATCAFPIGFPPRALVRPAAHYCYRVAVIPGDQGQPPSVVPLQPDWGALLPSGSTVVPADYHLLAVDGGVVDNEPIELARTALSGVVERNPRDPARAKRAVVLIDPFAGQSDLGPTGPTSLFGALGALKSTVIDQTRYDSADLMLAADPDVCSRFMITPQRDGKVGSDAIASAGLGAFLGFACPAFMRHDYLLGRANCQVFLATEFALREENSVFANDMWTADQKAEAVKLAQQFKPGGLPPNFLPIIPLLGDAAVPEMLDPWPRHQLDPEIYRDAIAERFKAVFEYEGGGGLISGAVSWALAHLGESSVADYVIKLMKGALDSAGLS